MTTYVGIRNLLISRLTHDSAAHEAGRYEEIGAYFDSVADEFSVLSHVIARDSSESDRLSRFDVSRYRRG
jgi:hypothetical protein